MKYKEGIGLFGLTGDPVHNGHLRVASLISQLPFISDLWIHVNANPHYKKPMFSFFQRKVFACVFGQMVFTEEYSYTYQALKHLRKLYGKNIPIYYFVGKEWDISTFKNADYVKKNCITVPIPKIEISIRSTQIREMIKKNQSLDGLCPETVINNIERWRNEIQF